MSTYVCVNISGCERRIASKTKSTRPCKQRCSKQMSTHVLHPEVATVSMADGPAGSVLSLGQTCVCFITAGPITKLFAWGGGEWRTCAMRDDEPRPVWMSLIITHWDP